MRWDFQRIHILLCIFNINISMVFILNILFLIPLIIIDICFRNWSSIFQIFECLIPLIMRILHMRKVRMLPSCICDGRFVNLLLFILILFNLWIARLHLIIILALYISWIVVILSAYISRLNICITMHLPFKVLNGMLSFPSFISFIICILNVLFICPVTVNILIILIVYIKFLGF